MSDWLASAAALRAAGEPAVLVTVGAVRGSAPRETGAKMIVTGRDTLGSIGGGQLEYLCTRFACELLRATVNRDPVQTRRYALGSGCGQCCGGVVDVWFERLDDGGWIEDVLARRRGREAVVIATSARRSPAKCLVGAAGDGGECPPRIRADAQRLLGTGGGARMSGDYLLEPLRPVDFQVVVFGAGHVGAAVVDLLSRLDCELRWIDSRRGMFPASVPANVSAQVSASPGREVAGMPAGAYYLVMTHSHPLDLEICDQVLSRGDAAYCGLIGSRTKRRRFEQRLLKQGLDADRLRQLTCPIGVPGIPGKRPAEIALAVAAQLLQVRGSPAAAQQPSLGLTG